MRESRAFATVVLHRRVLVHLVSGSTLRGILWRQAGPLLEMRNVELLEVDAKLGAARATPLDGTVVVERARVDFIQAIPGEAS